MVRKNGFTLVEMLGVIVIISLLMLTVVPSILNQVNEKKEEVSDLSEKIIFSAVDLYLTDHSSKYLMVTDDIYCISLETLVNQGYIDYPIKDMVTGNEIPLTNFVEAVIDEYRNPVYNVSKTCSSNITKVIAGNFTNSCILDNTCTINDIRDGISIDVAVAGEYGGDSAITYTFNVIDTDSEYLTLMAGESFGLSNFSVAYNSVGPITLFNQLNTITSTWDNIDPIIDYNYIDSTSSNSYGYTSVDITSGNAVITTKSGGTSAITGVSKSRLVEASELVNIIKDETWDNTNKTLYNDTTPSWLIYDKNGIGNGYFSISSKPNDQDEVWYMSYNGYLDTVDANINNVAALRPVIKIKKSNVKNYISSMYIANNASNDCVTLSTCSLANILSGITVDVAVSGNLDTSSATTYTFTLIEDDGINLTLMGAQPLNITNDSDNIMAFNTLNTDGPVNIFNSLNVSTSMWSNIPSIVSYNYVDSTASDTYGYNYLNITDGETTIKQKDNTIVTINGNTRARILSIEEIEIMTSITTWDETDTTITGIGTMGMQTLTANPMDSSLNWIYSTDNGLINISTSSETSLFPVIVIPKNKIS